MDDLQHDPPAFGMHSLGDESPPGHLFGFMHSGHLGIAVALNADRSGFGDVQSGGRALTVIFSVERRGNAAWTGAHTGQRRHDDAVRK
jgi:hypothetical protein